MPKVIDEERTMKWEVIVTVCLLGVLLNFLSADTAMAHRVAIYAWLEGTTVHTISKTGNGKVIKDAAVSVRDSDGNHLLEGKTDREGRFSFEIPQKTDLIVALNAAMGHRAEWKISAGELSRPAKRSGRDGENGTLAKAIDPSYRALEENHTTPRRGSEADVIITRKEMEDLINDALDKKLGPILALMAEFAPRGPGLTEIFSGIGYIVGIAGVALYLANRKKNGGRPS